MQIEFCHVWRVEKEFSLKSQWLTYVSFFIFVFVMLGGLFILLVDFFALWVLSAAH